MIKGTTALSIFMEHIDRTGEIPTEKDFVSYGYHRATYYRIKREYKEYLNARIEDVADGGNAQATLEDDIAEGLI